MEKKNSGTLRLSRITFCDMGNSERDRFKLNKSTSNRQTVIRSGANVISSRGTNRPLTYCASESPASEGGCKVGTRDEI